MTSDFNGRRISAGRIINAMPGGTASSDWIGDDHM
jgi:hypothetical protein